MAPGLEQYVVPASLLILIALFSRQSRGRLVRPRHGRVVRVMAIGGLLHILDDPSILEAISPVYGISFLLTHGTAGLLALGAAFLSSGGGGAVCRYGHFRRRPTSLLGSVSFCLLWH